MILLAHCSCESCLLHDNGDKTLVSNQSSFEPLQFEVSLVGSSELLQWHLICALHFQYCNYYRGLSAR